ncbi:hypothetical protein TeGR_g2593 [Tetraparma gracilis]|uniref:Uncharacterized protein n=1 Tax=Tetraparma gracilis TaxID=2962635 RepID=A0ABQ6M5F2_9STRA|nr:hypothetical protein TeGR_g2593 [Tetraparma gracilis]
MRLSLTRLSLGRLSPAARRTLTRCESVPVLSAAASPRSQSRSLTPSPSPEDRRLSPLPVSIFRLIYNLSTSLLLHRLFRTTLLPPPLGSGTTRACWSLSLIDDPLRAPLALAFLLQLSLESSSLLTHLLLTRLRPRPGYVLERLLAASLLLLSFVLTSTRRLGALGILYANLSQACLNLLQISLALRRPTGLPFRLLFLLLVLLPFLHLRIYSFLAVILPSAVHESGPYIAQLGAVTDPRVAKIACAAFGALGVGFFLMNVLYVGRLWGNAQVREQWRSARPKMD